MGRRTTHRRLFPALALIFADLIMSTAYSLAWRTSAACWTTTTGTACSRSRIATTRKVRRSRPNPCNPRHPEASSFFGTSTRRCRSSGSLYGEIDADAEGPDSPRADDRSLPPPSTTSSLSRSETLPPIPPNAHRVVLMRHGESEFNNANIFTGWCDVALTQRGMVEAVEAGQVFRSHELHFRKCYTSLLTRSIVTAHRSLEAAGVSYTPIVYDWRLNERHYGALQGLSKERTADRLGRTRVMKWRRSYEARPPLMQPGHPHYDTINQDPRYHTLTDLPLGESLEDCQTRVVESWREIVADIAGELSRSDENDSAVRDSPYSLVVAHANSLRALVMHLDNIPAHEIESLNIPTAIPFYYDVDVTTGAVLLASRDASASPDGQSDANRSGNHGGLGTGVFRGVYIADERKKRSFLERRRAANDPWLWALHDHQVERSMLVAPNEDNEEDEEADLSADAEALEGMEQEAKQNTETHSVVSYW